MRARHFLALFAAGLTTVAAVGCGSDTTGTGITGGTGGTGGTGTTGGGGTGGEATTSTGGTGGGTTTGTGGIMGDGNDSFEEAIELAIDDREFTTGDIDPAATDADYFKFTGSADQAIFIITDSKPNMDPYAEGYPDLVLTVYDKDKNQIAQNDDPFPRNTQDASLVTILPAAGEYFIKIEEFCASELADAAGGCPADYFDGIVETLFGVVIVSLDPSLDGNVQETEPNDTGATASPLTYSAGDNPGQYFLTVTWGDFKANDKDFFVLNIPADVEGNLQPNTRTTAGVSFYPGGIAGDGSTSTAQIVQVVDPVDGTVVAEVDASTGGELQPPLTAGKDYWVLVNGTNTGAHPFYFFNHSVGGSNPIEAEGAVQGVNDTVPQALTDQQDNADGSVSFFIEGNLPQGLPVKDVDQFEVETNGLATVSVACGAGRSGSGLEGFKITVLNGATSLGSGTESADKDLVVEDLPVPGAAAKLVIKLEATGGQSATVTSDFYRCGIHFQPAAP